MYVLCNECKNHYDDSYQSEECAGIGRIASRVTTPGSAHAVVGVQPVAEHVSAVRQTRRAIV